MGRPSKCWTDTKACCGKFTSQVRSRTELSCRVRRQISSSTPSCLIVAIVSLSPSSSTPSPVLRGRSLVFQVQSHKQELLVFLQIVLIVMPTMETNITKKPTISRADFQFSGYQVQSRMVVSCPSRPHWSSSTFVQSVSTSRQPGRQKRDQTLLLCFQKGGANKISFKVPQPLIVANIVSFITMCSTLHPPLPRVA